MILLRFVCALAVVCVSRGDPALHPQTLQGPQHDLHSAHFDVHNNLRYDLYRNQPYNLDNSLNFGAHRSSPFGYHDDRPLPSFLSQRTPVPHTPALPVHRVPAVTTFNAPAVNSLRGSAVIPNPYVMPPHAHNVISHGVQNTLNTVHETPLTYSRPVPQPKPVIPIRSQYHVQDELGQYSFGYDAGISTRQESRDAYGTVRGSFSYIDSNGEVQTQHYVAGKNGFQVRGTNLPVHVTNQGRYKRSYATFPAATGPLTPFNHIQDPISATPYYVYGPPRQGFSYTIQANPQPQFSSFPSRLYYPDVPQVPNSGIYY